MKSPSLSNVLSVRLEPKKMAAFDKRAKTKGVSRSDLGREVVDSFLKESVKK